MNITSCYIRHFLEYTGRVVYIESLFTGTFSLVITSKVSVIVLPRFPNSSDVVILVGAFTFLAYPHLVNSGKMNSLSVQSPGGEGMPTTLSVCGPKDPPNTPIPRFVHSVGAPDADNLGRLLVEALGRVQTFDEAGTAHPRRSGATNGSGECMALGDDAWIR